MLTAEVAPSHAVLAPARPGDRAELEALLAAARLPLDGLDDAFPGGCVVARLAGRLVGAAAVEVWGTVGLLRSVVVAAAHRGRHLADALVADRIEWARARGLTSLSLLTTGAEGYFARLGFTPIPRTSLPPALARSTQAALPACSTAVAMQRALVAE